MSQIPNSPAQATKPTQKIIKEFIQKHNSTTTQFQPHKFLDWEKQPLVLKSKEVSWV